MPNHMEERAGFYYLHKPECPPKPQLGLGYNTDVASLEWTRPGWYGPSEVVYRERWRQHVVLFERSTVIVNNARDAMRDLAARLRTARGFGAE